jgi:uncharacterized protein (TIGR02996 family)
VNRESLEVPLVRNPDDRAAHVGFADWLAKHDDPYGEFIQVQLALEDENAAPEQRRDWQRREQELLAQHQREWLGSLAPFLLHEAENRFTFVRGWLDRLAIPMLTESLAEFLALAPQLRLLRELRLFHLAAGQPDPDGEYRRWRAAAEIGALACSSYLTNIRVLQLGIPEKPAVIHDLAAVGSEPLFAFLSILPRLEELFLHVDFDPPHGLFDLETLSHLRILTVDMSLPDAEIWNLADCPNAAGLSALTLQGVSPDGLRGLLRHDRLPRLTRLNLYRSSDPNELCRLIAQSSLASRLKFLGLANFPHDNRGRLSSRGVALLAACPALRNLEMLDISHTQVGRSGLAALRAAGIPFQADGYGREDLNTYDDLME